ncbi:ankyrin repeat domain-containing protein [Planctomyces sp. SH-PL62]|uniref:ankyrin repeat domain-containing protein n=1 Tax=Planctomyces sp. SH-PL62 TaxID=1636152 RepID=UPI00078BEAC9|nr:ankyrin repeat domain-containing protein [Planctomyces sp. SH-PL62]AMV36427.1 Ankyrin repeats (3 copies) [Planctomyces sp. SH-PL62]
MMFSGLTKLAAEGDEAGVRRMLDEGAPVDVVTDGPSNMTPLQVAAKEGHLEVVKLLLERGADVNHVDEKGFTPVTTAARASEWQVLKVLAEHGGDFRTPDKTRRNGHDYLRRCRGQRTRARIQTILETRGSKPKGDEAEAAAADPLEARSSHPAGAESGEGETS